MRTHTPKDEWYPAEGDNDNDDESGRLPGEDVVVSGWDVFEKKLAGNKGFIYEVVDDPAAKRSVGGTWEVKDKSVSVVIDHASTGKR